ncbi:MAG TPA: NAD synthetase, partial [Alphaproteobacteria bacterium]|nr:NAD synthetase [Alphaproteobacteria bacterium]
MTTLIQLAYLVAAVLFILGLRNLSSPKTAPLGNWMAAVGMLIAVVATLLVQGVVDFVVVAAGVAVGSVIGAVFALRVAMTAMPQMVALLNGFGGAASALVAGAEASNAINAGVAPTGIVPAAMVVSV